MKGKKHSVSQITPSPIRHTTLSKELVSRIKAYKMILAEVDESSLEDAIEDFKRDENPEIEVALWERITQVYQTYMSQKAITNSTTKKAVLAVILGASMGVKASSFEEIQLLDEEEIKTIFAICKSLKVNR